MDDDALRALFVPFDDGRLAPSPRTLILGADDGFALREHRLPGWVANHAMKPEAERLAAAGIEVREPHFGETFDRVLLVPSRQRQAMRAEFACALAHCAAGGWVVASVANNQGARSAEADFRSLLGGAETLSKHKCRVFFALPERADAGLAQEWRAFGEPLRIEGGWWSRAGIFSFDRIDRGSALLAAHLPDDLHGRVADLGAGFGFLSVMALHQAGVTSVDLFEADARALEPARRNLDEAMVGSRERSYRIHWHDVTRGLRTDKTAPPWDAIVMNPPFHVGRADRPALGIAFIECAADALGADGRLFMVANRHLPYEATLGARFAAVRTLIEQDGYKVIAASAPRPR